MWKRATRLIVIVLVLIAAGIIMLASTSGVQGQATFGDPHHFIKRQLAWLVVAAGAGFATSWMDYRVWRRLAIPLSLFSILLLVAVLVPHVGLTIKGSSRWMRIGPMNFQPSELAKFSTVVFLAWWMARVQRYAHEFRRGLLVPVVCLGVFLGLIFIEPDFGTTILVGMVGMTVMFVAGTRFSYLLVSGGLGLAAFSLAVMQNAERMRRIIAFLNPEKYAQDEAYQLLNAIYAFVVGGGTGVGLGQSLQKHSYLPEAHTDFIFAIVGEELGLAASVAIVFLYAAFFISGLRISFRAPDQFGVLLGFGITLMITVQALINIAVVTGSMPTKGLPLPFISFGGSSLVMSLAMVGVLVNIARQAGARRQEDGLGFIKDAAHRI